MLILHEVNFWYADPLLAILTCMLYLALTPADAEGVEVRPANKLWKANDAFIQFCGKQSFYIFLFHTFIYSHWFKNQFYALKNPLLIYLSLLFVCLVISAALNYIYKGLAFILELLWNKTIRQKKNLS